MNNEENSETGLRKIEEPEKHEAKIFLENISKFIKILLILREIMLGLFKYNSSYILRESRTQKKRHGFPVPQFSPEIFSPLLSSFNEPKPLHKHS